MDNYIQQYLKSDSANSFQLLAYKTLILKLILAFDFFKIFFIVFLLFTMNVEWIFSEQYSLLYKIIINNNSHPSTQILKDGITQMSFCVLTFSNDPSKRHFDGLVIQLLDERMWEINVLCCTFRGIASAAAAV